MLVQRFYDGDLTWINQATRRAAVTGATGRLCIRWKTIFWISMFVIFCRMCHQFSDLSISAPPRRFLFWRTFPDLILFERGFLIRLKKENPLSHFFFFNTPKQTLKKVKADGIRCITTHRKCCVPILSDEAPLFICERDQTKLHNYLAPDWWNMMNLSLVPAWCYGEAWSKMRKCFVFVMTRCAKGTSHRKSTTRRRGGDNGRKERIGGTGAPTCHAASVG